MYTLKMDIEEIISIENIVRIENKCVSFSFKTFTSHTSETIGITLQMKISNNGRDWTI